MTGFNLKEKPQTFVQQCAQILHTALRQNKALRRKANLPNWAQAFNKLLRAGEIKHKRLSRVLEWYIEHIDEDYVPQAYSANGFCDKFIEIERAMQRSSPQDDQVTISDDAYRVFELISDLNWPCHKRELLSTIELSLQNYRNFRSALHQLYKDLHAKQMKAQQQPVYRISRKYLLAQHLDQLLQPCAITFVAGWLRDRHYPVSKGSPIAQQTLTTDHNHFMYIGYDMVGQYSHKPQQWASLLSEIKRYED